MSKVTVNDVLVDFDAAVNLMDDELREDINSKIQQQNISISDQDFVDLYIAGHQRKYSGETFIVN